MGFDDNNITITIKEQNLKHPYSMAYTLLISNIRTTLGLPPIYSTA